jgi:hypothetical protein
MSKRNMLFVHGGIFLAVLLLFVTVAASHAAAQANDDDNKDKGFDVRSSAGDMHLGNDANLREIGLPAYPGARARKHDDNRSNANLSLFTSAFGIKLLIANYDSDDPTSKIIAFYRDKLKKYGKVLECRTDEHAGDVNVDGLKFHDEDSDDHSSKSKELKCEGDNKGSSVELKAGTEDDQHVVAIQPTGDGKGSTFALIYVHARGKQADI